MPAVCVSRSRTVIGRCAGTCLTTPRSFAIATLVCAKDGINVPARVVSDSDPSSINCITAVLVSAFVCDAMRKIVSVVMRRPASLSAQPKAFS